MSWENPNGVLPEKRLCQVQGYLPATRFRVAMLLTGLFGVDAAKKEVETLSYKVRANVAGPLLLGQEVTI
jgi:hypothetical protein